MTYKEKLINTHKLNSGLTFEEWLIADSERNHKKMILMAGDLGQAFSRIGELESKLKHNVALGDVRLSLPSDEEIYNNAILYGKKETDGTLDSEQLDLIQGAMMLTREAIVEMNSNEA